MDQKANEGKTGCVYAIQCKSNDNLYIGSTIIYNQRLKRHRDRLNGLVDGGDCKLYNMMRENGGLDNHDIFPFEEDVPQELLKYREQFYMDLLEPNMNTNNAVRTREEYLRQRREEYLRHKTKYLQKVECVCGATVTKMYLVKHLRTQLHKNLLEEKKNNNN